jgi:hypothetical protein
MKKNLALSMRLRIMRLLTLICFFHFSGLNNGITCMVASSGKIESAGFAPVLISRIGFGLNPSNWSAIVSHQEWLRFFSRSGRVIEISSQKAIRNMFLESTLFQVWMHNALSPEESRTPVQSALQVRVSETFTPFSRTVSEVAAHEVLEGTKVVYLNTDYEDSWLKMERCNLLKDGKSGPLLQTVFLPGLAGGLFMDLHATSSREILRFARDHSASLLRRIVYSAERSSDGPALLSYNKGRFFREITPKTIGVIFFLSGEGRTA